MVQMELLWAAIALMVLGAAISLCAKCQRSGKVLTMCFGCCLWPRAPLCSWDVLSGGGWLCSAMCQLKELCPRRDAVGSLRGLCWWSQNNRGKDPPIHSTPSLGWV